ncbi:hypothetical protein NE237_032555 [Protea cynaroides]|uniref:Uncharacterized protein n=1 Tax=Protea cynaroides TaxID=273540 RepID=A0A9Q0R371_9MAGN|nr:hypothetical protein NE237_032555 [Protea cynaroides]
MGKKERGRRRWEGDRKETGGRRQEEGDGNETGRRREEGGGKKENGRTGEEGEGKKEKGLTSKNLLSSSAVCALPALCNLVYRVLFGKTPSSDPDSSSAVHCPDCALLRQLSSFLTVRFTCVSLVCISHGCRGSRVDAMKRKTLKRSRRERDGMESATLARHLPMSSLQHR